VEHLVSNWFAMARKILDNIPGRRPGVCGSLSLLLINACAARENSRCYSGPRRQMWKKWERSGSL
jgi:hypothetical protein